jgi:hypothetical protein
VVPRPRVGLRAGIYGLPRNGRLGEPVGQVQATLQVLGMGGLNRRRENRTLGGGLVSGMGTCLVVANRPLGVAIGA